MVTESELVNAPACVLGIDPGMSGAVVRLGGGRLEAERDFKTTFDVARAIRKLSAGVTHAVMELVHAMPQQGVVSTFSFGRAAGAADGALAVCLPASAAFEEVTPQTWQKFFRSLTHMAKRQVFDSRETAARLFPSFLPLFKRVKDHNTADALLIAAWRLLNF